MSTIHTSSSATDSDSLTNDIGFLTLRGSYTPLKVSGALSQHPQARSIDLTPVIGREYPELNLVEVLKAENSDELLRDLAITISERGVAFFCNQHLSINELKEVSSPAQGAERAETDPVFALPSLLLSPTQVIDRLGKLSGKPSSANLHIHPTERSSELPDDISTITSARFVNYHKHRATQSRFASRGWHSEYVSSSRTPLHPPQTFWPFPVDNLLLFGDGSLTFRSVLAASRSSPSPLTSPAFT